MSLSNEWFEYHLTPQGWVDGSENIDFAGLKEKETPSDRVLTLRFHEYLSSAFSKPKEWYEERWRHKDTMLVNKLIKKYGEIPEQYKNANYEKR